MFLLILLLFCFTIFAFVVTNKGAGRVILGRGYKEYRLGDYSNWLQKRIENDGDWRKIKSCLQDSKICQSLTNYTGNRIEDVYTEKLSAVQVCMYVEFLRFGSWFSFMNLSDLGLGVGLNTKPDLTIETWAHKKALEQLEAKGIVISGEESE